MRISLHGPFTSKSDRVAKGFLASRPHRGGPGSQSSGMDVCCTTAHGQIGQSGGRRYHRPNWVPATFLSTYEHSLVGSSGLKRVPAHGVPTAVERAVLIDCAIVTCRDHASGANVLGKIGALARGLSRFRQRRPDRQRAIDTGAVPGSRRRT
jgi:hypothetical protein